MDFEQPDPVQRYEMGFHRSSQWMENTEILSIGKRYSSNQGMKNGKKNCN
jgi:hypothetical protein